MTRTNVAANVRAAGSNEADCPADVPVSGMPTFIDIPLAGEAFERRCVRPPRPKRIQLPVGIRTNLPGALVRTITYARCKLQELQQQAGVRRRRMDPLFAFAREMLTSPSAIGAVCPSSPDLARAMAREVGGVNDGLVLELGAGTGNITHALLQQGVSPTRLIAIERSLALASHLRKRFPEVRVIVGDATQLSALLANDTQRVRAVVSGLPLRSLPRPVVQGVLRQIRQVLPEDGLFVQFTYDLRTPSLDSDTALKGSRTRMIWKNIPPARVDTFVRQADKPQSTPAEVDSTFSVSCHAK